MEYIVWLIAAYVVGNFLTAYIFAKLAHNESILESGSGNPGARNAGRMYGRKAFFITFFGDAFKILLIVLLAKKVGISLNGQLGIIFAVILGHIYPVFFKFRGGKGVACYLVGMLLVDPYIFIYFILAFILLLIFVRSFTIACMIAIMIYPLFFIYFSYDATTIFLLYMIAALIILAHKENVTRKFAKRGAEE